MFGKCFLHRPVYSETAVNVLPNTVLLKCSNCDTEHSVGQPCPAVWSGHFNLKDLATALGNRARNCTEGETDDSPPHIPSTARCILYNLYVHCSWIISSGFVSPIFMELPGLSSDKWPNNWITRILLCSVCCACDGNCWGALPHIMFVLCSWQQIQMSNISADKQVNITL